MELNQYPDFLVIDSDKVAQTRERLSTMGLKEVDRFAHGLSGVFFESEPKSVTPEKTALLGPLHVSLDQFVLFMNDRIREQF